MPSPSARSGRADRVDGTGARPTPTSFREGGDVLGLVCVAVVLAVTSLTAGFMVLKRHVRAAARPPRHRAEPAPVVPAAGRAPDARSGAVDVLPGRSATVPAARPPTGEVSRPGYPP
jgi:hypothetical protein